MANKNLEEMWRIMKEDNFAAYQKIADELKCSICRQLMVKACNGPCGCRYCWECISIYLNGETRPCPNPRKYCKNLLLSLNENIELDRAVNVLISSLEFKCANLPCRFKDDILAVKEHSKTCNEENFDCPFLEIGCQSNQTELSEIQSHLFQEHYLHSKMLMEFIMRMNSELEFVKRELVDLKDVNQLLKKELKIVKVNLNSKQVAILQLQTSHSSCTSKRDEFKQKMFSLRKENKSMRREIEQLRSNDERKSCSSVDLDEKYDKSFDESDTLKYRSLPIDHKHAKKGSCKRYIRINPKNQNLFNKSSKSMRNVEIKTRYSPMRLVEIETFEKKPVCNEFLWKIENWKSKLQHAKSGFTTEVFSDPFYIYKNGYKMCLRIDPNGDINNRGTHLSLFFHLMKGDNDNELNWPFRNDVTLSICYHNSRLSHFSDTLKFNDDKNSIAYERPTHDTSACGRGYPQFISLNELTKHPDLIQNDRILIKCKVHVM